MVTIAELKKLEDARRELMILLQECPKTDDDLWVDGSTQGHLMDLLRMGLVDMAWIQYQQWFWLTEDGWHKLGFEIPNEYGDPRCEDCDGKGEIPGFEDNESETCDFCDGTGVWITPVFDMYPLDED
jgi:hypothetical protein